MATSVRSASHDGAANEILMAAIALASVSVTSLVGLAPPVRAPAAPCRRCASPRCGPRVRVLSVGKTKESWLNAAIDEYLVRLRPNLAVDCEWVRDDDALVAKSREERGALVLLDERGRQLSSRDFSAFLYETLEQGGSRATFVIGGADGLPAALRDDATARTLSLSKLTFTHQMARLLLVEQLYRGVEIRRGSKYHRD